MTFIILAVVGVLFVVGLLLMLYEVFATLHAFLELFDLPKTRDLRVSSWRQPRLDSDDPVMTWEVDNGSSTARYWTLPVAGQMSEARQPACVEKIECTTWFHGHPHYLLVEKTARDVHARGMMPNAILRLHPQFRLRLERVFRELHARLKKPRTPSP